MVMKKSNFFNIAEGSNFSNLSTPVDASRNKFSWLKIHEFRYEKDLFGFKFRYNLREEYRTCVFRKKNTRLQHPRLFKSMPILHPNGCKLKAAEVVDLYPH